MASRSTASGARSQQNFMSHRGYLYFKIAFALCLLAVIAYFASDPTPVANGGTVVGYALGTISLLIIVWLSFLGVRKRLMTSGKWSLRGWTSAHVYLGLSLIILATLHTGFQFGWNIHTLAYVLMMLVILSGAWGLYAYLSLPIKMAQNRDSMTEQEMLVELDALDKNLGKAALPLRKEWVDIVEMTIRQSKIGGSILSRFRRNPSSCGTAKGLAAFKRIQTNLSDKDVDLVADVVAILERKKAILYRIRSHIRYRALLEVWLSIHIPVTFALILALVAHVFSVFYYW